MHVMKWTAWFAAAAVTAAGIAAPTIADCVRTDGSGAMPGFEATFTVPLLLLGPALMLLVSTLHHTRRRDPG